MFQLGNYGASRIASRLSPEYSKVANILLLTLPGTPICYYGDELGMENLQDLEYEQVKDLRAKSDPVREKTILFSFYYPLVVDDRFNN